MCALAPRVKTILEENFVQFCANRNREQSYGSNLSVPRQLSVGSALVVGVHLAGVCCWFSMPVDVQDSHWGWLVTHRKVATSTVAVLTRFAGWRAFVHDPRLARQQRSMDRAGKQLEPNRCGIFSFFFPHSLFLKDAQRRRCCHVYVQRHSCRLHFFPRRIAWFASR